VNVFEITLDVDKRRNNEVVNLRQGDVYGTTINATLRDHDVPMEGGGYTAMFCMTLPDRKTFYHDDATYDNGVVSVVVNEQYAAQVPGSTNNAYFELYDGEELKYTTASFVVRIAASAMEGEAAQSYDPRVEELMGEMRDLIDTETEAEQAREESEQARCDAEAVRSENEQLRSTTFAENEGARSVRFLENEDERAETFSASEAARATTFAESESYRSSTFAANEGYRQGTFSDNEQAREDEYDSLVAEWTTAESSRAATFSANENARQATFDANERARQDVFDSFASPSVAVEETSTGQVAHITWHDTRGTHVSDMAIDDAISVTMTGDTFSVPVDPAGACVESGTARFYFSGWVGDRMEPCTATITSTADSRFTVRITNGTAREQGLIRIEYTEGTTYPHQLDVCTLSLSCGGRTFLHRISAVAPRGGAGVDGVSPTVSVTDAVDGKTVTITDVSGEHSYTVPDYTDAEAARVAAEAARVAAESERAEHAQAVSEVSEKIDAITARGATVNAEYLYRKTNGGESFSGKMAAIESIHGRSVVWNQKLSNTVTWGGIHGTATTIDGVVTLTGSEDTPYINRYVTLNAGHKYLTSYEFYPEAGMTATVAVVAGVNTARVENPTENIWTKTAGIVTVASSGSLAISFYVNYGSGNNNGKVTKFRNIMLFDLTQMFGAGNEPSTVAEFEALYPDAYYPYDAGSLQPVRMTGVESVGFNRWDEVWEVGSISNTTGENVGDNGVIRSKNYIPVFPSTVYQVSGFTTNLFFYDASKAFISNGWQTAGSTFTTPSNCRYVRFRMGSAYGNTYKGDICLHLSGPRNGDYEPHWRYQRAIDAGVLRGAGTVYDELTADERIVRVGEVDLGTLTWSRQELTLNSVSCYAFQTTSFTAPFMAGGTSFTCAIYDCMGTNRFSLLTADKTMAAANTTTTNNFFIRNDSYTDAAAFKSAMQGVMLHYALATPTTTPIDPALNLTYKAEQGGTERITHTEQSAPPTLVVTYDVSLVDELLTLPEDYISRKSFDAFCDALAQAVGITIDETWNESTQQYDYQIVSGS